MWGLIGRFHHDVAFHKAGTPHTRVSLAEVSRKRPKATPIVWVPPLRFVDLLLVAGRFHAPDSTAHEKATPGWRGLAAALVD